MDSTTKVTLNPEIIALNVAQVMESMLKKVRLTILTTGDHKKPNKHRLNDAKTRISGERYAFGELSIE